MRNTMSFILMNDRERADVPGDLLIKTRLNFKKMIENPKENNDDLAWDLTSLKKALTPREFEIAKLVLDGKTSLEIASILQIRPRTVEVHRYNTLRKLRIRNSISLIKRVTVNK
ncbi:MAG: helix-turn-helix transcriptional regulator [Bacteroidetes bacterium]|nr:helix-turn-helix transcriptional regulator [Bacteroidota bacterium]